MSTENRISRLMKKRESTNLVGLSLKKRKGETLSFLKGDIIDSTMPTADAKLDSKEAVMKLHI
jgi:hypothetical protein